MFYIYRITNKVNGKTYIGQHKNKKLDDNYMGSGKHFSEAHLNKLSGAKKEKLSNRRGVHLSDETKRKISEVQKGKHWYNNGEISVTAKECPEGFVKGRICKLVDGKKVYL